MVSSPSFRRQWPHPDLNHTVSDIVPNQKVDQMATAVPGLVRFHCSVRSCRGGVSLPFPTRQVSLLRFTGSSMKYSRLLCNATSAAGGSHLDSDENPYEVLGVSPIEGFDMMKAAYKRRCKDAERRGDDAALAKLERAYDKIMMSQLTNRKKGLTFGSFQVSKDIKYADKQPVIPWGPRFSKSSVKDMRINMAISAAFIVWIFIQRYAEWKPMQFLSFVYVYRMFEKLKANEPVVSSTVNEEGEDEGRGLRMGKRILRSLALVFGFIAVASLGFTGILNLIEFLGQSIPVVLYNNQELFVTASTSIILYILASYYR